MMATNLLSSNLKLEMMSLPYALRGGNQKCCWTIEAIGPFPINTDYTKIVLGKKKLYHSTKQTPFWNIIKPHIQMKFKPLIIYAPGPTKPT